MGYYADCRKYIKERNIDEIVKIDDNVLFNLAFGVNRHKGYFGQPLIGTLTSLMLKYSRVEDKILNMCKRKKYDIYKDHDFDLYRFRNGLFSPSDYSEDMIKYLFGGTGGINLTKVKEEKQQLYAKHIIQNNIKVSSPSYWRYALINETLLTEEQHKLAKELAKQFTDIELI